MYLVLRNCLSVTPRHNVLGVLSSPLSIFCSFNINSGQKMYFCHREELGFIIHLGTFKYKIYVSFRAGKKKSVSFGWRQILLQRLNELSLEMPISCQWSKNQTSRTANSRHLLNTNSSVSWIPPAGSSLSVPDNLEALFLLPQI